MLLLFSLAIVFPSAYSVNVSDSYNEAFLLKTLLKDYEKRSRPVHNISTRITLSLEFYLIQILKLSERDQILTSNTWLTLHWKDEFLTWDTNVYKINEIRIPAENIWIPDLTLYNNAQESDPLIDNMLASRALVTYDGNVSLWPRPLILQSNCEISVRDFPFDTQECTLTFSSWAYSGDQVRVQNAGFYNSSYVQSIEWNLVNYSSKDILNDYETGVYSFVAYTVDLRRKHWFYVFNLIIPCFMLTLVMLFSQYMPCQSGDAKVQLGNALFTSMCVFMLLVGTMMPPSDMQPLLGIYYCVTLCLITSSTGVNVLVLNVVERDTCIPRWVHIIFLYYLAKYIAPAVYQPYPESHPLPIKKLHKNHTTYMLRDGVVNCTTHDFQGSTFRLAICSEESPIREIKQLYLDESGRILLEIQKLVHKLYLAVNDMTNHLDIKKSSAKRRTDWQDVAVVLDRALMICFTLVTLIAAFYVFNKYPSTVFH